MTTNTEKEKTTFKELLLLGQTVAVPIHGASMRPLLHAEDTTVVIEPLNGPFKKGDLPLYLRSDGTYAIHRIIKLKGQNYWTLGDNTYSKEYVEKDQILGIVTQIIRKGKYISVLDKRYKAYVWIWIRLTPMRIIMGKLWIWIKSKRDF